MILLSISGDEVFATTFNFDRIGYRVCWNGPESLTSAQGTDTKDISGLRIEEINSPGSTGSSGG
jgi:hypothetical protein